MEGTCSHIWTKISTLHSNPASYRYQCKYCNNQITTKYVIPSPTCLHEWFPLEHSLGPKYTVKKCSKCQNSEVKLVNPFY